VGGTSLGPEKKCARGQEGKKDGDTVSSGKRKKKKGSLANVWRGNRKSAIIRIKLKRTLWKKKTKPH